jgi:integrase
MTTFAAEIPGPRIAPRPEEAPLIERLDLEWLRSIGWDDVQHVLAPGPDVAYFAYRICPVLGCYQVTNHLPYGGLCQRCHHRWLDDGAGDREAWVAGQTAQHRRHESCLIERDSVRCARPTSCWGLCREHAEPVLRGRTTREEVLATGRPYSSYGVCAVAACDHEAARRDSLLCMAHVHRWKKHQADHRPLMFNEWCARAAAIPAGRRLVLRGLSPRLELEVLYEIHCRARAGKKTVLGAFQLVVDWLRFNNPKSALELSGAEVPKSWGQGSKGVWSLLCADVRLATLGPEEMRHQDFWWGSILGKAGNLDFTPIRQKWLREVTKSWAWEKHLGYRDRLTECAGVIRAVSLLSDYLATRPDGGELPNALGRDDIVGFCNQLAVLARRADSDPEALSSYMHSRVMSRVHNLLRDSRDRGHLDEVPSGFTVLASDVPDRSGGSRSEEPGRALPNVVVQQLLSASALELLEARDRLSERRAIELLAHTGRRPSEICSLAWNCLRDSADGPVLVYVEEKITAGEKRMLPIPEAVATIIRTQQDRVATQFPHVATSELALFPTRRMNPDGKKSIAAGSIGVIMRQWVAALDLWGPGIGDDGQPRRFDRAEIYPYALRHSFAQRHADAGVAPDVLQELMGHRSMATTQIYYRITEKRRREAMDLVAPLLVTKEGALLQHAMTPEMRSRLLAGRVAVPFGYCTEPSNVQAGGHACPLRYHCLGCGHFRSDPSYLGELKRHLRELRQQRSKIEALSFADDWAKERAKPSDDEIERLDDLIIELESELQKLSSAERAEVEAACDVLRIERAGAPSWTPVQLGETRHRGDALREAIELARSVHDLEAE